MVDVRRRVAQRPMSFSGGRMNRRNPDEPEAVGSADLTARESAGTGPRPRGADESAMWTDDDFTASGEYVAEYGANEFGALGLGSPSRPALGAAIRRRAWVWMLTAVVGLVLG